MSTRYRTYLHKGLLADTLSLLRHLHFRLALFAFNLATTLAQQHPDVEHLRLRRLRVAFRQLTSGFRRRLGAAATSGAAFHDELRPRGLIGQRSERRFLAASRRCLRLRTSGFATIVLFFQRQRRTLVLIALTVARHHVVVALTSL